MDFHSDFWQDSCQHIGLGTSSSHTERAYPTSYLTVSFPKNFWLRLSGSLSLGCGPWTLTRKQEGGEKVQKWLASSPEDAINLTIWLVHMWLHCFWPLNCLIPSSPAGNRSLALTLWCCFWCSKSFV